MNVLMAAALGGAVGIGDYLEALSVAAVVLVADRITKASRHYVEALLASTEGALPPQVPGRRGGTGPLAMPWWLRGD